MELKPCPFCGGDVGVILEDSAYTGRDIYMTHARCFTCGAEGPWRRTLAKDATEKEAREFAIKAWNERQGDEPAVPDPRAGLRRCEVADCGEYFFHQWASDGDGEACAIIESMDGVVQVDYAWKIRFTDIPQAEGEER